MSPFTSSRLLHTMLRVRNLDASVRFYTESLGMSLLRRLDFPDGRFTLAFVGYGAESVATVIELTHNWDRDDYHSGDAFGHLAIEVPDVARAVDALSRQGVRIVRAPGPLAGAPAEIIAFVEDPDGYRIELIERKGAESEHAF
jgi:lactoylglutathione lyase